MRHAILFTDIYVTPLLFTRLYIGQGKLSGSGRNDLLSSFCAALQVTPSMDFGGVILAQCL